VVLDRVVPSVAPSYGAEHDVVGRVDAYRFVVPGGGTYTIPCVVLDSDVTGHVDPCAAAGGTFVEHRLRLGTTVPEPNVEPNGEIAHVRVCTATWRVTVLGFGVEALPGLVLC
jgi:hypothetical protein